MYFRKALILLFIGVSICLQAQISDCDSTFFKVIGDPDKYEFGYSVVVGPDGNLYVGGSQEGKALLLKCTPGGEVIWAKTLDFTFGTELISEIMFDSDGMIAGCGYLGGGSFAGDAFAFRFNPLNQQVLWTQRYFAGTTFVRGMIERSPGGNYLLSSDTQSPNDAELIEVNRLTGIQVGSSRKVYSLGSAEAFNEMEIVGNFMYCAGRFTDGNDFAQMRGTVAKLNLSDLSVVWTILTHVPTATQARLYTQDMVIDNNSIITVNSGDDNGSSILQTEFFLQKTDFDGNVTLMKKYDVLGVTNEFMEEVISVPDGYVAFGRTSIFAPSDLLVVKVDKNFNLLWARRINYETNDNFTQVASGQSKCIAVGSDTYFTASAENNAQGTADILLFKINAAGEINDSCLNVLIPVNVIVTDIANPFVNSVTVAEFNEPMSTTAFTTTVSDVAFIQLVNPCACPVCVVPIPPTNLTADICTGESYDFYGQSLTMSGTYTDTLTTFQGCDSTVVLDLTVFPVQQTPLAMTLCPGETFQFGGETLTQAGVYTDTLATFQGCDSVVVLTLDYYSGLSTNLDAEICDGETYTFNGMDLNTAGMYVDTLASFGGCDSIVNLNLQVWPNATTAISETICANDSFLFNGMYLSQSGTYTEIFQTFQGCDSTVTLQLNVLPVFTSQLAAQTCEGEPFEYNGQSYTQSGMYDVPLTSQNGCDSTVTLDLTVFPVQQTPLAMTLCPGETFQFGGETLTQAGVYTDTLATFQGCDSVVVLTLNYYSGLSTNLDAAICDGETYTFNGMDLNTAGMYVDTLASFGGCDSIVNLNLQVWPNATTAISETICANDSFLFNGMYLSQSGTYTEIFQTFQGCDSTVTLQLNVLPVFTSQLAAQTCEGEPFEYNGQSYTQSGMYDVPLTSQNGCDSTVTLDLTVFPVQQTPLAMTLCPGETFQFGGETLTQAGVYSDTLATFQGCDSVVVLTLNYYSGLSTNLDAAICDGETYTFNGMDLNASGMYVDTLASFGGCDSIVNLNLQVWPNATTAISETICANDSFLFNGMYLSQSGTYTEVFQTFQGCDSTVTLQLNVLPVFASQLAAETCEGEPFEYNGQSYTQSGMYDVPLTSQNGCDSTVTLDLTVNPPIPVFNFSESICEGESYDFYGQNLSLTGTYSETLTAFNGCDSSIVLQLTVYEHQDTSLSVYLCDGQSYDGYTESGLYTDTLQTFAGCDSIRTLQLSFQMNADSVDVDLCDGETFQGFSESGIYTDTIHGADGCDTLRTYVVTANNLYVPNVFSPDDNGINDYFEIFLSEPTNIQITYFAMFDRWGNMLYEVKNNNVVKWDGSFRGKPMNPAVLSYVLLYRCNGFEKDKHGSVTIVR